MTIRPRTLAMLAVLWTSFTVDAYAANGSLLDVSTTTTWLDSANAAYGPWTVEDVSYRFAPDGSAGVEIANRRAADRYHPSTEQFVQIDKYARVSRTVTIYGAAAFGSAAPFPQSRYTAEADVAAGKHFVLAAGGSAGTLYGIGATRQLILGGDYYAGNGYASLRYRPSWSAALGNTQSYSLAVGFGRPQNVMNVVRVGGGGENDTSLVNPLNPTIVGERDFGLGYSFKKWTTARTGYHVDLGYGTLSRTRGGQIYSQNTFGAGLFYAP